MKKNILIVTNEFPYGNREVFLESEILVLSNNFDKIIILPVKKLSTIRNVPVNVHVDNTLCDSFSKRKKNIFLHFLSYEFLRFFLMYIIKLKKLKHYILLFKYYALYDFLLTYSPNILLKYPGYIVYSYWFSPVVDALVTLKNSYRFTLVCRVHRGDLYEQFTQLGFFPNRENIIKYINAIFVISLDGYNYLNAKYNLDNLYVSRLGTIASKNLSKSSKDNIIRIVSVSNIIPIKRVKLIAESLINFCTLNNTLVEWNHFGDGADRINIERYLLDSSNINFSYKFFGMLPNKEILKFYTDSPVDLFINLSESEGIPVSIMEAISFGIPVLATNVGGVSEIVNETTGLLLPAYPTCHQVSNSIKEIFSRNINREDIYEFWNCNYNGENNYRNFSEQLYKLNDF